MSKAPNWSDEDIGFLADNHETPLKDLADALGRTVQSVSRMRRKVRDGYTGPRNPSWSEAEDLVLVENPAFTAEQLLPLLPGRHVSAIVQRRTAIGAAGGIYANSPYRPGDRTLVARTCLGCGSLRPSSHFWGNKGRKRSQCRDCESGRSKRYEDAVDPETKELRRQRSVRRAVAYRDRAQAITVPLADNNGNEYTEADHAVLSDPTMSNLAKALMLKRSYIATLQAVYGNGYVSKVGTPDPDRERWLIDNPNADRVEEISELNQPQLVPSRPEFEWND